MTGLYLGAHMLLAKVAGPQWLMSEADGKYFAMSLQAVLRHYPIETTQKAMDIAAFVGCCGFLYVPRIVATAQQRRSQGRPPPVASVVYPFPSQAPGGPPGGPGGASVAPVYGPVLDEGVIH
jgi:hypothetical protein